MTSSLCNSPQVSEQGIFSLSALTAILYVSGLFHYVILSFSVTVTAIYSCFSLHVFQSQLNMYVGLMNVDLVQVSVFYNFGDAYS